MTIPNLVTTLRIILAPIFVIYLIHGHLITAMVILVIGGVSDGIDGLVARLFNQKSRVGTYLDPLADKIMLIAAFIALTTQEFIPSWLTVTVISRDVLILVGVLILFLNSMKFTVQPTVSSKITTCLQFVTVILVLSRDIISFAIGYYPYVFYVTALFTIISFLQYMYQWFKIIGDVQNEERPDRNDSVKLQDK